MCMLSFAKDKVLIYVVPGPHALLVLNVIKKVCCFNRSALNLTDSISGVQMI